MKLPLTRGEFREIYAKVPRLNVEVIIAGERGVVLAMRQDHGWEGLWHIPGGTVYMGETLEQAVVRVAKRELGVEVKIIKLLDSIVYPTAEQFGGFGWPVGIAFLVEVAGGKLGTGEEKEIAYFKSLPEAIVPEQKVFLEKHGLAEA